MFTNLANELGHHPAVPPTVRNLWSSVSARCHRPETMIQKRPGIERYFGRIGRSDFTPHILYMGMGQNPGT